jgi:hypothetical protein
MGDGAWEDFTYWEVLEDDDTGFEFRVTGKARHVMWFEAVMSALSVIVLGGVGVQQLSAREVVSCGDLDRGGTCEFREIDVFGAETRSVQLNQVEFLQTSEKPDVTQVHLMTSEESTTIPVRGGSGERAENVTAIQRVAEGQSDKRVQFSQLPPWAKAGPGKLTMAGGVMLFLTSVSLFFLFQLRWVECGLSTVNQTLRIGESNFLGSGELERPLDEIKSIEVTSATPLPETENLIARESGGWVAWIERWSDRLNDLTHSSRHVESGKLLLVTFTDGKKVALNRMMRGQVTEADKVAEGMRRLLSEGASGESREY